MANVTYRFRATGPQVSDLSKEVPGTVTFSAAGYLYVDVTVDSTLQQDLTDAMAVRGWAFDSSSPSTTPAQQAASNGSDAINFLSAGTLVAKQPSLNIVSGATVVNNAGANRVDITIPAGVPLTSNTPSNVSLAAAAVGTGTASAKDDHVHLLSTAAPTDIGTANSAGTGTSSVRNDHVHNLPFAVVNTVLGTANASISVNSQKITNLLDPANPQDAATKNYVDSVATGLDVKNSVRVATTGPLPTNTLTGNVLTASANGPLPTLDSTVTVVLNDRILVKNEATAANNGLYYVSQVGVGGSSPWKLTRTLDADTSAEVTPGLFTFVEEGTANGGNGFVLTTIAPITLNSTGLTFAQFSGAGQIVAGTGLTKTGNTLNVIANADGSIVANADDIQVGVLATDAQHGSRGGGTLHSVVVNAGAAGFMSGADKTKLDAIQSLAATSEFMWGNGSIGTSTSTRYMAPGYSPNAAVTSVVQMRVPRAGTVKNLRVHVNSAGTGAANLTFTVRKNSVATALACTFSNTATDGSDLVDTVTFAAGDLIDVTVAKSASITGSPTDLFVTVEFSA